MMMCMLYVIQAHYQQILLFQNNILFKGGHEHDSCQRQKNGHIIDLNVDMNVQQIITGMEVHV